MTHPSVTPTSRFSPVFIIRILTLALTIAAVQSRAADPGTSDLPESWVNPPRDDVKREKFTESELAPLVAPGPDGELIYSPFSKHGDRFIDFSTAGYKRSEEPIPTIPVVKTLAPPGGEATPMDNMAYPVGPDSFDLIQRTLNEVAAMEPDENGFKGAVLLKKGTWYVNGPLLVRSGVVLRGEEDGEDGTVLVFTLTDGNATGVQVGKGGGTTVQTRTSLSGMLVKDSEQGEAVYRLNFNDGTHLVVQQPKFSVDYRIEDYAGSRVTAVLPLLTTTQGYDKSYRLKHNMPYTLKRLGEGEEAPARHPGLSFEEKPDMPETRITDSYVPTGADRITVANAGIFEVGDLVNVIKTTNETWIDVLGVGERLRHIRGGREGAKKRPWKPTDYSHLRTITAIDGNTLTLDVMLPQSIVAEHGGGTVRKAIADEDTLCGVEGIRVVSNYDKTQTSNSKSANYMNLRNGIGITALNGWVRDCTVLHVSYAAVRISGSRFVTVRDCTSLQPVGAKRGGKRYTYAIGGGNNVLVYNCFAEDGRHDFVLGARMAGPFVFLRCTALRGGQSEPHARWGVGALYDNITMKDGGSLAAINRGDSGSGHGWAAANTVFWNCDAKNIVVYDPETPGENNFAIGYSGKPRENISTGGIKYANTRAGYWGTPQEGVFYGVPLMGSGYIQSPDAPVEPPSLFEQQLIDRIGPSRAAAVLQ